MKDSFTENRTHKRFASPGNSFAICDNMVGQVIDISESGMSIKIVDRADPFPENWLTTFICSATETRISNLPLQLARVEDIHQSRFGAVASQTIGVKFSNPDITQLNQIREHIDALESVEIRP